jgi:hypothetical protein
MVCTAGPQMNQLAYFCVVVVSTSSRTSLCLLLDVWGSARSCCFVLSCVLSCQGTDYNRSQAHQAPQLRDKPSTTLALKRSSEERQCALPV